MQLRIKIDAFVSSLVFKEREVGYEAFCEDQNQTVRSQTTVTATDNRKSSDE